MNLISHVMFYWNSEINSAGKTNSNKPDLALKIWHEKAADKELHCA
jgi:hypothetical protein